MKQFSPNEVTDEGIMIDVKLLQPEYLEVIDYQLFAVNTVEKWIGSYLWVYGKWRFNDFNLLWRANVRFGWQNEGRKRNKGMQWKEKTGWDAVVTIPILIYGYTDNFTLLSVYI